MVQLKIDNSFANGKKDVRLSTRRAVKKDVDPIDHGPRIGCKMEINRRPPLQTCVIHAEEVLRFAQPPTARWHPTNPSRPLALHGRLETVATKSSHFRLDFDSQEFLNNLMIFKKKTPRARARPPGLTFCRKYLTTCSKYNLGKSLKNIRLKK